MLWLVDIYCPCGKWVGRDYPDTEWEPGYYDGVSDYYSEELQRYYCSQDCLDEYLAEIYMEDEYNAAEAAEMEEDNG